VLRLTIDKEKRMKRPIIEILADPRYTLAFVQRPMVTSKMKAKCIGEFQVSIAVPCTECDHDKNCAVCGGGEYNHSIDVPWTTMKDIYKMMAKASAAAVLEVATEP
jgi:hypothetical protein